MPVRSSYVEKACQACRSSKRRCLREDNSESSEDAPCKRCDRMGLECRTEKNKNRRKTKPKSKQHVHRTIENQSEFNSAPYNFLLLEAGGLPLPEDRMDAIHAITKGSSPSITQIDWLIDDDLCDMISKWSDIELGSLFPLLPPANLLRSQRRKNEKGSKESTDPAILILEFSQYLCASRHLYPANSSKRFPGVEIEAMVRPFLQQCLSEIILRTSFTPSACLAFQVLCFVRIDRDDERKDPPYILLSSALRAIQIANVSTCSERDSMAFKVLWCSAFACEISYILGSKEGQLTYKPYNYEGLSPNAKDMEEIIALSDSIAEAGYVGLDEEISLKEQRRDAIKAILNRTASTIIFSNAWRDIWLSTKALREDKSKHTINDEDQLVCLAKTGQAMSAWDLTSKRLSERRMILKGRISETLFEFLEVEAQFANTILLGHCLRMQIESAIDVDVLTEFNGLGLETALITYVRLLLTENVRAVREAYTIDQTRLQTAKMVLVEQVGKLAGGERKGKGTEDVELVYPALISIGHFFEAAKEVLQAHAPHLEISRSNLASHDSWAILAWAVKGLVTSLLLTDYSDSDSNLTPSTMDEDHNESKKDKIELASEIVERHCQHVEARMILDLPFPLPSTHPTLIIDSPIALA